MIPRPPAPSLIRCPCGNVLGELAAGLVVVRVHVRGRQTRTIIAPVCSIRSDRCGRLWETVNAETAR